MSTQWYYYQNGWLGEHLVGPVAQAAFLDRVYLGRFGRFGKRLKVCSPTITDNQWTYAERVPAVVTTLEQRGRLRANLLQAAGQSVCHVDSRKWFVWTLPLLVMLLLNSVSAVFVLAFVSILLSIGFGNAFRIYTRTKRSLLTDEFHLNLPVLRQAAVRRVESKMQMKKLTILAVAEVDVATCGVCGESIYASSVKCKSCYTPHHDDCWDYLGHCSVYGCGESKADLTIERRSFA